MAPSTLLALYCLNKTFTSLSDQKLITAIQTTNFGSIRANTYKGEEALEKVVTDWMLSGIPHPHSSKPRGPVHLNLSSWFSPVLLPSQARSVAASCVVSLHLQGRAIAELHSYAGAPLTSSFLGLW